MVKQELIQQTLMKSEEDTAITLDSHYGERIAFHMKMLNYYLNEQTNEKLAT